MKLTWLMDFYINNNVSNAIQIIISIAIIFSMAFLLTRLTKLVKLPNVTAYIISGVIIGPYVLNMIPEFMIDGMAFLSDVAMAFIAFSIGRYFDIASLKKGLGKIVVITLFETIFATVGVGLLMWAFNLPIYIALLLGSIAATTSSVSTMMTIKQYRCTGEFVETTLKVIAFDNIISLILFSLMLSISKANLDSSSNNVFLTIFLPILLNILVILIGGFFGFILSKIITPNRTKDNRLILTVAMNLFLVGICGLLSLIDKNVSLSPLLGSMAFGVIYVNLTKDSKIVSQLSDFGAPITLLFFVRSGMSFNLPSLLNIGLIGLVYLVSRVVFKYLGSIIGALVTKSNKNVIKYLGMPLIPQAGVSIGLASLVAASLGEITPYADTIQSIIIATGIIYEFIGPALAKLSLKLAGGLTEENIKKVKSGEIKRIDTSSMLHDAPSEEDTEEHLAKLKMLNSLELNVDKANRYIHTKEYGDSFKNE